MHFHHITGRLPLEIERSYQWQCIDSHHGRHQRSIYSAIGHCACLLAGVRYQKGNGQLILLGKNILYSNKFTINFMYIASMIWIISFFYFSLANIALCFQNAQYLPSMFSLMCVGSINLLVRVCVLCILLWVIISIVNCSGSSPPQWPMSAAFDFPGGKYAVISASPTVFFFISFRLFAMHNWPFRIRGLCEPCSRPFRVSSIAFVERV